MPAGHPVADVLRLLADCDSTGSLHVAGPPRGAFHLEAGSVVGAEADGVPPGEGPAAVLDAATAVLGAPAGMPPRFTTGTVRPPAGAGPAPRYDVARLLLQVDRALDLLARAPVGPDGTVVVRALDPPSGRGIRIDAGTWPLVGRLARPVSPRTLSWALGMPLLDTVLALGGLVDLGAVAVVAVGPPAAAAPSPVTRPIPALPAAEPPRPRPAAGPPGGPAPEAVVPDVGPGGGGPDELSPLPVRSPGAALAQVRREATRLAAGGAGSAARGLEPRVARPEADLVLRLLDGLRRL